MKTSFRLACAALVASTTALVAHAGIERVVEKSFPVTSAGLLRVETQGGQVRVMPSSEMVVHITAKQRIRATSEAEADDLLKKLELTFEQNGSEVRVSSKYPNRPSGFHIGSWPPVQVDIEVMLPAAFATDVRTSGGGITMGDLQGNSALRTSGGSIKIGNMGGTVTARSSGGSISVGEAGGTVDLKTSGGSISVGRVAGPAKLETSGGGIKIDSVANTLQAHTSGGSIRASIAGPLKEECSLSTSGGSVRVNVDKAAAFRLDASTSGGNVEASGLPITMDKVTRDRSRIAGTVNGGGPLLKLRASGGGISVRGE